ncbi:glycosyl hydrolase [Paenibacillus apii]|uniref:glycosyl hydrolase n=1 Tax=Paenibacillus apii TaxID=1850370 RepID=UPI00143A4C9D|nr:glycosyl hydrolase [Paenibacillus apii]NJJ38389.1 hypothetical protein [Paenibacillus apii]
MDDRKIRSLPDSATSMITDGTLQREYSNLLLKEPVNPNISPSARALLSYLYQLQGKAIISGQHEYLESPNQFSPYIFSVTGKYPKLKGVEFGAINGQSDQTTYNQRANVVNACKDWVLNKGGIITATYHAAFPGTANTWANVQADCTPEQFEPIITPGTDLYNALIEDIDQVAVHLKALRDADVPVLWRPYHEMNGTWFWWGGQPKFNNLWEIMYSRYVNVPVRITLFDTFVDRHLRCIVMQVDQQLKRIKFCSSENNWDRIEGGGDSFCRYIKVNNITSCNKILNKHDYQLILSSAVQMKLNNITKAPHSAKPSEEPFRLNSLQDKNSNK